MQHFVKLCLAGLWCAVDWQTPDGLRHQGSLVYTQSDAELLSAAQQIIYPTYQFTVRCE